MTGSPFLPDAAGDAAIAAVLKQQPLGKIHPQGWMIEPETRTVFAALAADGAEVRFIGGCVRDTLMKRAVRDIDLALAVAPAGTLALLQRAGIRAIPTGIDHGTVTAVIEHRHFEITSLRVDVETDGRRARVAFTDDWVADAARRDFTINAMSASIAGDVYDYFGGIEDLAQGRVRFVGNARARIVEDALRLLRYFRIFATYGRPPADLEALEACAERAADVRGLSGERVRGELFRILMAEEPSDVIELMREFGVLAHVLPEAGGSEILRTLNWLETKAIRLDGIDPDPTRRLAALVATNAPGAAALADRLKFSNRERRRLITAVAPPMPVTPDVPANGIRRALHRLGIHEVRDLALLGWAAELAPVARLPRPRTEAWLDLLKVINAWQPTAFPLKGRDALALGLRSGPGIGVALRDVEAWWEAGGCVADHEACLQRLTAALAKGETGAP